MRRWWRAFLSTCDGLAWGLRRETAIREEVVALIIAVPLSFLMTQEAWLRLALIGSLLVLLIVELLNTAIEKLCDHLAPDRHEAVKAVKDLGSAAVFGALLLAAAVWLLALARLAG